MRTITLILILLAITLVSSIGVILGDDNENELGLCLNYHIQAQCDKIDINRMYKEFLNMSNAIDNHTEYCHDHYNNGSKVCHNMNMSHIDPLDNMNTDPDQ